MARTDSLSAAGHLGYVVPIVKRLLAACVLLVACKSKSEPQGSPSIAPSVSTSTSASASTSASGAASSQPRPQPELDFVRPSGEGELEDWISGQVRRAKLAKRRAVVYVSAVWCEPCRRFKESARKGEIAGKLPPTTFLEVDLDQYEPQLKAIGYQSKLIPLFAIPGLDGRPIGKQIEGSIKGPGATDEILPRLSALLTETHY